MRTFFSSKTALPPGEPNFHIIQVPQIPHLNLWSMALFFTRSGALMDVRGLSLSTNLIYPLVNTRCAKTFIRQDTWFSCIEWRLRSMRNYSLCATRISLEPKGFIFWTRQISSSSSLTFIMELTIEIYSQ